MKVTCQRGGVHRRERGSVVLVAMILLAVMTALIVANSQVLYSLDRELQAVEQRQLKKFQIPPSARQPVNAPRTNSVPR